MKVDARHLDVPRSTVSAKDRVSFLCDRGQHDECSGVILVGRNQRPHLCDCSAISCTCRRRAAPS